MLHAHPHDSLFKPLEITIFFIQNVRRNLGQFICVGVQMQSNKTKLWQNFLYFLQQCTPRPWHKKLKG